MKACESHCASRRAALRTGLGAGVAVAIVALHGRALAQAAKLAKDAVKYTDHGTARGKDCDDCSQYIAPAKAGEAPTCRIVEGPISAHGHCIAFTPKGK